MNTTTCHACFAKEIPIRQRFCSAECMFWYHANQMSEGCWIWTGPINKLGNPELIHRLSNTRDYAHRYSYKLRFGSLPEKPEGRKRNVYIGHGCGNKLCVNPDHLMVGRSSRVGRQSHTLRKLTDEDVCEIRKLYKAGVHGRGAGAIGKQFGVAPMTITKIVKGITYRNV